MTGGGLHHVAHRQSGRSVTEEEGGPIRSLLPKGDDGDVLFSTDVEVGEGWMLSRFLPCPRAKEGLDSEDRGESFRRLTKGIGRTRSKDVMREISPPVGQTWFPPPPLSLSLFLLLPWRLLALFSFWSTIFCAQFSLLFLFI